MWNRAAEFRIAGSLNRAILKGHNRGTIAAAIAYPCMTQTPCENIHDS
jgi:hypothetical protein